MGLEAVTQSVGGDPSHSVATCGYSALAYSLHTPWNRVSVGGDSFFGPKSDHEIGGGSILQFIVIRLNRSHFRWTYLQKGLVLSRELVSFGL